MILNLTSSNNAIREGLLEEVVSAATTHMLCKESEPILKKQMEKLQLLQTNPELDTFVKMNKEKVDEVKNPIENSLIKDFLYKKI